MTCCKCSPGIDLVGSLEYDKGRLGRLKVANIIQGIWRTEHFLWALYMKATLDGSMGLQNVLSGVPGYGYADRIERIPFCMTHRVVCAVSTFQGLNLDFGGDTGLVLVSALHDEWFADFPFLRYERGILKLASDFPQSSNRNT